MCLVCRLNDLRRVAQSVRANFWPWVGAPLLSYLLLATLLPSHWQSFSASVSPKWVLALLVLLACVLWREVLFPRLQSWRERRAAEMREMRRLAAAEMARWRKEASRLCRNCHTQYREQEPAGGRFMCQQCGHVSKRPVLGVPGTRLFFGEKGPPSEAHTQQHQSYPCATPANPDLQPGGANIFFSSHECTWLDFIESAFSVEGRKWAIGLFRRASECLRLFLAFAWATWLGFGAHIRGSNCTEPLEGKGLAQDLTSAQRVARLRRRAEERKLARLERELEEEEERMQREEVARLVEAQRRARHMEMEMSQPGTASDTTGGSQMEMEMNQPGGWGSQQDTAGGRQMEVTQPGAASAWSSLSQQDRGRGRGGHRKGKVQEDMAGGRNSRGEVQQLSADGTLESHVGTFKTCRDDVPAASKKGRRKVARDQGPAYDEVLRVNALGAPAHSNNQKSPQPGHPPPSCSGARGSNHGSPLRGRPLPSASCSARAAAPFPQTSGKPRVPLKRIQPVADTRTPQHHQHPKHPQLPQHPQHSHHTRKGTLCRPSPAVPQGQGAPHPTAMQTPPQLGGISQNGSWKSVVTGAKDPSPPPSLSGSIFSDGEHASAATSLTTTPLASPRSRIPSAPFSTADSAGIATSPTADRCRPLVGSLLPSPGDVFKTPPCVSPPRPLSPPLAEPVTPWARPLSFTGKGRREPLLSAPVPSDCSGVDGSGVRHATTGHVAAPSTDPLAPLPTRHPWLQSSCHVGVVRPVKAPSGVGTIGHSPVKGSGSGESGGGSPCAKDGAPEEGAAASPSKQSQDWTIWDPIPVMAGFDLGSGPAPGQPQSTPASMADGLFGYSPTRFVTDGPPQAGGKTGHASFPAFSHADWSLQAATGSKSLPAVFHTSPAAMDSPGWQQNLGSPLLPGLEYGALGYTNGCTVGTPNQWPTAGPPTGSKMEISSPPWNAVASTKMPPWSSLAQSTMQWGFPVPPEFVDSITHELMQDPVITADGHSYERSSILAWLREHDTSPLTGEVLPPVIPQSVVDAANGTSGLAVDKSLRPNHALRSQIMEYRERIAKE